MRRIGCLGMLGIAAAVFVVAAVIYPVLVMLVPGSLHIFDYPREKAQERKCMANLRMIGEAIQLYEEDFDAVMPWGMGGVPEPIFAYIWIDLFDPYLHQTSIMRGNPHFGELPQEMDALLNCPSAPSDMLKPGYHRTYGYNRYLAKMTRCDPLIIVSQKVKYPATTIRITETSCPHPRAKPKLVESRFEGTFAPVPDWKAAGLSGPVLAPGWHDGRNNVLWVDGHISTMSREEVMLTDSNPDPNVWARLSPKP